MEPTPNAQCLTPNASPDWWRSFYDDTFADVVMATGEDATAAEAADFLIAHLRLSPGDTVFDQGCGLGRVSLPLARHGLRAIGVDLASTYIRRASEAAEAAGLPCEFYVGDSFQFVPERPCDGAFNWWSSFGYAEEDARNREMLARAFEALRPGGRFAMDYYSGPRLLREFREAVTLRYQTQHGEAEVRRSASLDFRSGVIEQVWEYDSPCGEPQVKRSRTRMYLPHELCRMLTECGFREIDLYGGQDGSPFDLESPRCVLVAQKP